MKPVSHPKISIIIPTYNACALLRESLLSLVLQRMAPAEFEVIVADDGSSDETATVVESFSDRLRLRYCFQEDLGHRVAAARNAGARLAAAPVLSFLDAGTLAGPDYLRHHLEAFAAGESTRRAVLGYAYCYRHRDPTPGLADLLARVSVEELVRRHGDDPAFWDERHEELRKCDFDLSRLAVPWQFCWGMSCSVGADDFWEVGGFDEEFRSWGIEDLELGYRLCRRGVSMVVTRDGWVVESPSERDMAALWRSASENMRLLHRKHPGPLTELCWALISSYRYWEWDSAYQQLVAWTRAARDLDVSPELRSAARDIRAGERVAVFGCGATVPAGVASAVLFDFDSDLLGRALAGGRHTGYHRVGLRTPLPDQSVDVAIITSRLAGVWDNWGGELLAEAHRVGRRVRTADQLPPEATAPVGESRQSRRSALRG
jgi:glycosyltransferase involved in cell wall biosynthesis